MTYSMTEFVLEDMDNYEELVDQDFGIVDVRCYGGSPVEINGLQHNLKPELEDWLNSDVVSWYEYDVPSSELQFRDDADAMLFKLTWL